MLNGGNGAAPGTTILMPDDTRLIAIDWGTSSARAYALDGHGDIVSEMSAPLGVQHLAAGDFANALATLCGGQVPPCVPLIACGMIGSRQGWVEAPYRECPARFDAIAAGLTRVPGTALAIVPGLVCRDPSGVPDVMRGEETQIFGALPDGPTKTQALVLPGTHSKWAIVGSDGVETFATFMTGELFSMLREHSILGRLASGGADASAFDQGVRASLRESAALTHDLFSARTLALTGTLASEGVADYLSGLLLGAEIASARRWLAGQKLASAAVTLIGEAALCVRYQDAMAAAGITATIGPVDAAARGLWRIARHAGILRR
jgi:2-dehydro-3-deoxygalactonokinase